MVYRADLSTMRQRLRQGYGALAASQQEAVARDARARLHLAALVGPLSAAEIGRALLWALRRNLARRADLAQLIYQEWIESGRAVLAAELRRLGRGDAVRLSHDSYVFARAQQTARGLLETLERDAEALLAGLAPEDSEQALDHFLGWLQRRDQVRERLVAVTETQRAVGYFQQQFVRKNGLEGRARCTPEQAACPACNDYLQRGWVSLDEALGWDLPSHPNCPHELEIDYAPLNETSPLWTGE